LVKNQILFGFIWGYSYLPFMVSTKESLNQTVGFIQKRIQFSASIGLILGSGLGSLAGQLRGARTLDTSEIPNWPRSTVPGHAGRFITGFLRDVPVIVLQGRVHYYEGYTMNQVTFPVRVLTALGIQYLIVTNAAGALNPEFRPGEFMVISDHINCMGTSPLIGYHDPDAPTRFPDMSVPYAAELRDLALRIAAELKIQLHSGVLVVTTGPNYETAAEVRMLRMLGGDAVCMSTVPEVIVAVQSGLKVLGISCITNMATGLSSHPLSHEEVKRVADQILKPFVSLISGIVQQIEGGR
jgi:purine-nucleoside phosphorylase